MVKGHLQHHRKSRWHTSDDLLFCSGTSGITAGAADRQSDEVKMGGAHRVDRAVSGQVILVGGIVAMPGNHIKGRAALLRLKHLPAQLVQHSEAALPVLKACNWRLKVSGSCQTICT